MTFILGLILAVIITNKLTNFIEESKYKKTYEYKLIELGYEKADSIILDKKLTITKARGQIFDISGKRFVPIFHPSYLLRNDSKEKGSPKWLMWQDIKEIKRVYDELCS